MKMVFALIIFVSVLLIPSTNAQISYWSFNNPADPGKDYAGVNNGILINGPSWTPNGFLNGAIIFDGMDDYIDCGNDSILNMGTDNFSISFWLKKGEATDTYETIMYKAISGQTAPGYGFLLRETGGELKFTISDGYNAGDRVQTVGPKITDTDWHHAVGVRGGGKIKIYVDNQLVAETNDTTGSLNNIEKFTIGRGGYGNNPGGPPVSPYFRGTIDEVKIYNRTLSVGEINQIYQDYWSSHTEPPVVILNSPAHGEINLSSPAVLNVTVTDLDGDVMNVSFHGSSTNASKDNFIIIALPDTQNYVREDTGNYSHVFTAQTQWIVNNKDNLNMVFVTHEGDIVEHWDNITEWNNANASMSLLDGVLPYGVLPGNHDQQDRYNFPHNAYYYNQYFNYTRFENYSWYGGHYGDNNDNNYQFFSAGGLDFIIVHLENNPSDAALSWADDLLSNNSDRRAIVVSHYIISHTGAWSTEGLRIFNALKNNPNLFLMLCGHDPGGAGRRTDVVNNNTIHTIMTDYQSRPYGGEGWLKIFTFSPKDNKIYVKTYSPYLNSYRRGVLEQFTMNYIMTNYTEIGTNADVTNGSSTSVTWPGLVNNTKYYWYVDVIDGNSQTAASEAWEFVTGGLSGYGGPADLDYDGDVDIDDLIIVTGNFGLTSGFDTRADTITDGEVDIYDVVFVASRFT